jgi:hypothetical protein
MRLECPVFGYEQPFAGPVANTEMSQTEPFPIGF